MDGVVIEHSLWGREYPFGRWEMERTPQASRAVACLWCANRAFRICAIAADAKISTIVITDASFSIKS